MPRAVTLFHELIILAVTWIFNVKGFMKKKILCLAVILSLICQYSCKKFLDVTPLDKLTGVTFWQSQSDIEAFVSDLYAKFRDKLTSTAFLAATGELRSGYILTATSGNTNSGGEINIRRVYNQFAINNLQRSAAGVLDASQPWNTFNNNANFVTGGGYNFSSITKWYEFYSIIQGANIMFDRVNKGVPGVDAQTQKRYLAEAVFIRCLAYFMMVRIYGDVPYYTAPYQQAPLPRENMVSVIKKCIADLKAYKNNLYLIYPDPTFLAIRATKGAADDLLMNMDMWNAGFDKANQTAYYQDAANLGDELIKSNVYQLLPIENFDQVMRGRSAEGIFEFGQSINYESQPNPRAFFGEMMLRYPNKGIGPDNNSSHAYFKASYLQRLYPAGVPDKRVTLWFDNNMLSENGNFQLLKFKGNVISGATGIYAVPEWGLIIFRYAEAILLRAEALADLGNDGDAIAMLNMVRERAGAPDYSGAGGKDLKDAIFNERGRELMGEGHLYFDLIRTGRILDPAWTDDPLTQDQFDRGGWAWPIDNSALLNNPYMRLNQYWQ